MTEGITIMIFSLLLLSGIALGQTMPSVPSGILCQGRITDGDGATPADGAYEMSFLIYDASSGGNLLWSETHPNASITNGNYKIYLGAGGNPLEFSTFNRKETYLEVRIFGEAFGPRRRIVSAPFALKAEGEVPEGAVILGEQSGEASITGLDYTEQGDTIGPYYLYKKNAYNPSQPRVPGRIAYQGKVMPLEGGTVGPAADFGFTIFDADTGGTAVWSEMQNDVPVASSGLFSVELGVNNPVDPVDLVSKYLWLAVTVKGQTLLPREKLASAAYALKVTSPAPEGAIVLSATNPNAGLASKKFTLVAGSTVDGYYPFRKNAFNPADTSVPLLVNYQGKLTDLAGDTLSAAAVDLGFRIFDGATAGALLWSETVGSVALTSGIFNVLLGSSSPITPATFPGPDAWLQTTITNGATTETLSPRQRIASVPFALTAEGTMPSSALILSAAADSDTLTSSGYQPTGDTVSGYFIYGKTEADKTPPELTILSPQYGLTSDANINIYITYSDDLSGVNTSGLRVYHNGVEITTYLLIEDDHASGSVSGSGGGNIIEAFLTDNAGNLIEKFELVVIDSGNKPTVAITNPIDGETIRTDTPFFYVTYYDEGGIDVDSIKLSLNTSDITSQFGINPRWARADFSDDDPLADGSYTLKAEVSDFYGNTASDSTNFTVEMSYTNPSIAGLSKNFTIGGDTVTITGTGFGTTTSGMSVYFSGTLGGVTAYIQQANSSQIKVVVPGGAVTGKVWVENIADGLPVRSNEIAFTVGLPYAYITNRASASGEVTIIDYRSNTVVGSIDLPGTNNNTWPADVTPDGRWLLVANANSNTASVIDALTNQIKRTINLQCESPLPNQPFGLAVSPDGNRIFVVTNNNRHLSDLETRKALDPAAGDTIVVNQNYNLGAYGSGFQDIEFSPDGQRAIIATDGNVAQGYVITLNTARSFEYSTMAPYSNQSFMQVQSKLLNLGASRNPSGVGVLPQRTIDVADGGTWMAIISTQAFTTDPSEDSPILNLPSLANFNTIEVMSYGLKPFCFGGRDAAVSPLGDRAFFAFYYSNNLGMAENLTTKNAKEIYAATACKSGCSLAQPSNCTAEPWTRKVAYTPYLDKVIATIRGDSQATSRVMILNSSAIPPGTTGTISSSAYITLQHASINGPEGIGMYPLFDRDKDGISDLVEAINDEIRTLTGTIYFQPTAPDADLSFVGGDTASGFLYGAVKLPQEGMGYYHFHGVDPSSKDNWATLSMIQVIEQVGREWNQLHPEGPRIGVGDLSLEKGGKFCSWFVTSHWPFIVQDCHELHQQGIDADIRYMRADGREENYTFPQPSYDLEKTQELIDLFCEAGAELIYTTQDAQLVQPNGCTLDYSKEDDHRNHLHVRIGYPQQ